MGRFPASLAPIPEPAPIKEAPPKSPPHLGTQPHRPSRARFKSSTFRSPQSEFYRTIIDNNLFRPLGWTPARPTVPYRLLGTLLPIDANTPPKAIIQTTEGDQNHDFYRFFQHESCLEKVGAQL